MCGAASKMCSLMTSSRAELLIPSRLFSMLKDKSENGQKTFGVREIRLKVKKRRRAKKAEMRMKSADETKLGGIIRAEVDSSTRRALCDWNDRGIEPDKPRGPFFILFPVLALLPYQSCTLAYKSQVEEPNHAERKGFAQRISKSFQSKESSSTYSPDIRLVL
ncbi:hypothetical protein BTVI_98807 [Pitangus sulphuratus]|nr:hypothetical protein BTVI_98807 [Pitangus sulphuratus]